MVYQYSLVSDSQPAAQIQCLMKSLMMLYAIYGECILPIYKLLNLEDISILECLVEIGILKLRNINL